MEAVPWGGWNPKPTQGFNLVNQPQGGGHDQQ